MKIQKTLLFMMPLAVAAMVLVGCSDYDNGYTEKEMKFNADFSRQFGSFDETQDWNLAERVAVTVTTSELKDINVYTEKEGSFVQVGAFKNVMGTKKLEFEVIEDMTNLVVSDGDVALRAVTGGTVNFDNMTSVGGEVLGTRGDAYVNRNLWSKNYVVPANITDAERAAVVAEFSKQHYGAYNEVLVPWTELFVQQVYKGEAKYYNAFNQETGVASDKMNHLLIWDRSASAGTFDGGYIHINDFNNGNQQTVAYDDNDTEHQHPIKGLTLMRGIDPTDCPTEDVTIEGVTKHWVKQFEYHNALSDEYQPTYIMKRVTWTEDGVTKSGLYLGFDFYAQKRADQPAGKNMEVERDWIFNDWIIKISQSLNPVVPVSELQNATPAAWILAGEDLGGGFDIDYNDVVVQVERLAGENKVHVTPLAAGGTLASYLFFGQTCIGEIHQLLDASPARSGSYQPINLSGDLHVSTQKVEVTVDKDWGLTQDISKANNMGGFTIRVLPEGTEPMAKVLNYNDPAFDKATTVKAPQQGEAPYIICVPYAYKLTNYPESGLSAATVWAWPGELVNIASVYEEFEDWARDKAAKKDWYSKPAAQGFVSTQKFTRIRFGEQPAKMSDFEIQETGNPNADVTFYNQVPSVYPEVKQPAATLALKQEGDIYVTVGETIDLLNYVNTNYPDKVFCVSTSYGEQEPVAGSFTQFKTLQANHRTLMHIRIATPGGLLNVDVYVNSGTSSEDSGKKDNSITLYDNGTPVYNIPTIAAGETKTYTIKSNGSGSYSVVGSEYFTASVSGNTLTITGVKAGSANLIINQAADGTYKPATGNYWLTATGSQQQPGDDVDDKVDDGGDDTPSGGAGTYSFSGKQTQCVFTVESAGNGKYNVKYNGTAILKGVAKVTFSWSDNYQPKEWGGAAGAFKVNSPWSTTGLGTVSAQGNYTVTLSSAFRASEDKTLTVSNNNAGSSFYLTVSGE